MTIRKAIKQTPINQGETKRDYFKRVAKIFGYTYKSVEDCYYMKGGRDFVETQVKYDKNDNVISRVEKLQQVDFEEPKNMELVRLSTNLTTGQQWKIYAKDKDNKDFTLTEDLIKSTIKSLDLKKIETPKRITKGGVLTLTYTDVHVAMKIENDLYGSGVWNEQELFKALDRIVEEVYLRYDDEDTIIVEDLGDFMDGWNAQTTRGGHELPQNMDNSEAFSVGSKFKIELATRLSKLGCNLVFNSCVNDNHSASFGEIVNKHVKEVLSYLLPNVEYNILKDFISHYTNGKDAILLTHGKDKKFLKFGFPVHINDKAKAHINAYIDRHDLHGYNIKFKKGDSHQMLFDFTNPKFDYLNYMALSPSSEWVATNFAKGRRGFTIETKHGIKPIYL